VPPPVQKGPARPGAKPGSQTPEEAARDQRHQTDQLADEASKLEEELEALKAKYEQYFLGLERREPVRWREDVKKQVLRLKSAFTRNTGLRFRLQTLHARFLSYERLWLRGAREKEEGTYRRDVFKARLHAKREDAAPPQPAAQPQAAKAGAAPAAAAKPGLPATAPDAKPAPGAPAAAVPPLAARSPAAPASRSVKPAAAVVARPATPGAPRPPPATGGDARLRALYDEYVAAKRRCNEDVSRLTYDAVARSVEKQVPELMARYKAKSVDFRVEVKDGKAVLKAIPKV
jgi:hypothetical protein